MKLLQGWRGLFLAGLVLGVAAYFVWQSREAERAAAPGPAEPPPAAAGSETLAYWLEVSDGVLRFDGELTDAALAAVGRQLRETEVTRLRITARGRIGASALALAEDVGGRGLAVSAEGICFGSCTLLLAAAPRRIITPATEVGFVPPADVDAEVRTRVLQLFAAAGATQPFWEQVEGQALPDAPYVPILRMLIEPGLVTHIRAGGAELPAREWCAANSAACDRDGRENFLVEEGLMAPADGEAGPEPTR